MQTKPTTAEELARLTQQVEFLLKTVQETRNTDECKFWRGNVTGFRNSIEIFYGDTNATHDLLERLRDAERADFKAVGGS